MIDRLILIAVLGAVGFNGLFSNTPQPFTPWQLQVKAKEKSVSAVCEKRKKQSKTVKQLCKKWGKQQESL